MLFENYTGILTFYNLHRYLFKAFEVWVIVTLSLKPEPPNMKTVGFCKFHCWLEFYIYRSAGHASDKMLMGTWMRYAPVY